MKRTLATMAIAAVATTATARDPFVLREDVEIPKLADFKPLPSPDEELSAKLTAIVEKVGLDVMTPAAENPDEEDEWSSICLVDIRDLSNPVVAGWKQDNFVYPASTYKMYVAGEIIRQVIDRERALDDLHSIKDHNHRGEESSKPGQEMPLAELLRLTMQWSNNTTANELIDIADRQRVSALMHALGCEGSEVTRKYLPRTREHEGYADIVSTVTSAEHLATFLWAVETGAIGGGKGRGLIKGYLATNDKGRLYKALPDSATIHSKTGWWNIFTSEAAIIEDGETRYILCILTARPQDEADRKIEELGRHVHALMRERTPQQ